MQISKYITSTVLILGIFLAPVSSVFAQLDETEYGSSPLPSMQDIINNANQPSSGLDTSQFIMNEPMSVFPTGAGSNTTSTQNTNTTSTQNTNTTSTNTSSANATGTSQAQAYIDGDNLTEAQAQYEAIVGQYGECAVSQILARGISNVISNAVTGAVTGAVNAVISVPTSNLQLEYTADETRKEANLLRNKDVAMGPTFMGVPILPSWDAIGYCIINTMIEYISESTIQWINGGFQGNPVFVDNFGQFFKDLADIETATFLGELSAPDFLCDTYRVQIQTGLLQSYTDPYYQPEYRGRLGTGRITGYGQCSFDEAQVSLDAYVSGQPSDFQRGGWNSWYDLTQNPANNIYGSYLQTERELSRRVAGRQALADKELTINEGFLSFKDEKGNTTTPGKIIQGQIENRLNIPENRLVLAREFDEVVDALVNKLVKIALSEVLSTVNGN